MTYPEIIKYLESFINYENILSLPYTRFLKLERFKEFLRLINNPEESLHCLHVAGTKGKGSTCILIASILRQAGYKVGLYTSPHLSDFRERIRILDPLNSPRKLKSQFEGMIKKEELAALVAELKPYIQKYNCNSRYGELTFFEVCTAIALVYFKEKKIDFAILETGLGGRLDATNCVNSLVSVISPISYDHTYLLGKTLSKIAAEKAGIIKPSNLPQQQLKVVSAPQESQAWEVIRKRCKETGSHLFAVGRDIHYKKTKTGFNVKGLFDDYAGLKLRLVGDYQLINASVAIGAIEALRSYGINIKARHIKQGLYKAVWPGRCEVISRKPLIVLDGAQNAASMLALKNSVRQAFKYNRIILVLGVSSDKDIFGICRQLHDFADVVILTQSNNPRAKPAEELARSFSGKSVYITHSVKEAKFKAIQLAQLYDLVLVCGSLFVVGEFRDGSE